MVPTAGPLEDDSPCGHSTEAVLKLPYMSINRIPDIRACSYALKIDLEWSFHEIVSVVEMFGSQRIIDAVRALIANVEIDCPAELLARLKRPADHAVWPPDRHVVYDQAWKGHLLE